jgi:hypothetical protein
MGVASTISEYYSLLLSEMKAQDLNVSSIDAIKNNLDNDNIKSTYSWK